MEIGAFETQIETKGPRPPSCYARQKINRKKDSDIDIGYYVGVDEPFGKTAPYVKIGYSRKPEKPPPPTPGPGEYDPPTSPKDTRLPHKISGSIQTVRSSLTTNIGYINNRVFPRFVQTSIGVRDNTHFYQVNDVPTCSFIQYDSMEKRNITIGNKYPEIKPDTIPGPTRYTPSPVLTRRPAYTIAGPKFRDEWLYMDRAEAPPPGQYNPKKPLKSGPSYTIGDRSRSRNSRRAPPKNLLPIGTFIADIGDLSESEARAYVTKHTALRKIIEMIFSRALEEKPDDPITFIRQLFAQMGVARATTEAVKKRKKITQSKYGYK